MTQPVLLDAKTLQGIDDYRTADAATELSYPVIFSGTGAATGVQMGKIGDIYIKTDDSTVYIAKGTTKSTDWVQVSN
jgi:hypothetical protein